MIACITAALTLLALVLEALAQQKKDREANNADTNVQDIREALSKNDTAGVSARLADQHDRVSAALCGDSPRGDDPGEQDADRPVVPGQRAAAGSAGKVP